MINNNKRNDKRNKQNKPRNSHKASKPVRYNKAGVRQEGDRTPRYVRNKEARK